MRILVTGGAGRVGQEVLKCLVKQGYDVHVIDAKPEATLDGASYSQCDINDFDSVREQVKGCDKVVHLAAIPSPISHSGHEVFQINVAGTFNVFEAAAQEGIKRIAQASSINALGCFWSIGEMDIRYFPIDEVHPLYTTDAYSFSKQMVENIGAYYWRREGISSVAFRLPAVWFNDEESMATRQENATQKQQAMAAFVALPPEERTAQFIAAREKSLAYRAKRMFEYPAALSKDNTPWDTGDWLSNVYTSERFNFWTYINEVDSAQAFDKALFADYEGSHALFVNAKNNYLNFDTNTLLDIFFPDVTERKRRIVGVESPISNQKAYDLIGYEAQHAI
ncbi:MAG: NAD(P)-dependent oxidoreductase [Anaerolineae bacterium]|nr:NAD(P)-dependent oxidoreductase [Anaerolineae bacterium]